MKKIEETAASLEPIKRRKKPVDVEESVLLELQEESARAEAQRQPAITISIQSWATPIVGVLRLVLGLLAGYHVRPLMANQAQQESSTASFIGVRSTPTFLINGQAIVGAQPFEVFQRAIDSLLK